VLAEVMEVTAEIAAALKSRSQVREIRRLAVSQGMTTMLAHGVTIAMAGVTSLDEVMRVVPREP